MRNERIRKKFVVGVDEAGRGPLAGPVVAAAVASNCNLKKINFPFKIRDSKKLSQKRRKEVFDFLKKAPQIFFATAFVSPRQIEKINIFEATKWAMAKAVKKLLKKAKMKKVDLLLLDGNFKIQNFYFERLKILPPKVQKSIVKGDEKIPLLSLASVVAKVTRDRTMEKLAKKYPQYRFEKHKGYPTKEHFLLIKKYGFCPLHRKTFSFLSKIK